MSPPIEAPVSHFSLYPPLSCRQNDFFAQALRHADFHVIRKTDVGKASGIVLRIDSAVPLAIKFATSSRHPGKTIISTASSSCRLAFISSAGILTCVLPQGVMRQAKACSLPAQHAATKPFQINCHIWPRGGWLVRLGTCSILRTIKNPGFFKPGSFLLLFN